MHRASPGNTDNRQYYQCFVSGAARDTKKVGPRADAVGLDDGKADAQQALGRSQRIELRRFGVFSVKPRKTGIGRKPRTGEEVTHLPQMTRVVAKGS